MNRQQIVVILLAVVLLLIAGTFERLERGITIHHTFDLVKHVHRIKWPWQRR